MTLGAMYIVSRAVTDFAGGDFGLYDTRHNCVSEYQHQAPAEYEVVVIARKPVKCGERGEFMVRGVTEGTYPVKGGLDP